MIDEATEAGANGYLVKPINMQRLRSILETVGL